MADLAFPRVAPGIERHLTSDQPVPDAVRMIYRPSFTLPGRFVVSPLLVRKTNRCAMLRGVDAVPGGLVGIDRIPDQFRAELADENAA